MKQIIPVIIFILSILSISCKNEDSAVNQPIDTKVVMALKVGNVSAYRFSSYDSVGAVQYSDTIVFKIVRDTLINSERWYLIGSDSYAFELLTNRSDGLWYMRLSEKTIGLMDQPPILLVKYPANINDLWPSIDSTSAKYSAANVSINVPLGNYVCNQYAFTNTSSYPYTQNMYFPIGKAYARSERVEKYPSGLSVVVYSFDLINISLLKQDYYYSRANKHKVLFIAG